MPDKTLIPQILDQDSNLWFATEGAGAVKFDGKNWITYTTEKGLASDVVYSIFQDKVGNIWIGTDVGVNKLARH